MIILEHCSQDPPDVQSSAMSLVARSLVQVRRVSFSVRHLLLYLAMNAIDPETKKVAMSRLARMQAQGFTYYSVHDLLLDFAKNAIDPETKEVATSRQAQYLGRLDVLKGFHDGRGYLSLMALWRSLEDLSGDKELEVKTYESSLEELKESKANLAKAEHFNAVASLFHEQVGHSHAALSVFFVKQ